MVMNLGIGYEAEALCMWEGYAFGGGERVDCDGLNCVL